MDVLVIGSNEYRVASQIPLPKRCSNKWRHFIKILPSEWQLTLLTTTACWRRYQAMWEIADHKLFLSHIEGCYQLVNPEQALWAEWITGDFRVAITQSWFYNYDTQFEQEFWIQITNGVLASNPAN